MRKQPEVTEITRQKFVDAFWELARTKPMSKIAVSELTKLAGYNRSTFYEYFLDTDDLLAYAEKQILTEIKQTVFRLLPKQKPSDLTTLSNLFPVIFAAMNERLYLLMGPNGDPGFLTVVQTELVPVILPCLPITATNIPHFDYLISYVSSASFGLLQHWHEQGKDISTEEICTLMQDLILPGLFSRTLSTREDVTGANQEKIVPTGDKPGKSLLTAQEEDITHQSFRMS